MSSEVLEVTGQVVKDTLKSYKEADEEFLGDENTIVLYIHFGVAVGYKNFTLERQAFNEAHFRCPDQGGWNPSLEPIDVCNPFYEFSSFDFCEYKLKLFNAVKFK